MSATDGSWEAPVDFKVPDQTRYDRNGNNVVTDKRGLFVLHSCLLHTGRVLVFCGHVESADYGADGGNPMGASTSDYRGVSYVFDPSRPNLQMTPKYFPPGVDLFCCHYVQMSDGRILVVGGSVDFHVHGSMGAKNICYFDPNTESWELSKTGSSVNYLDQGRWYPTAVMTGRGKTVVFSGRDDPSTSAASPFIADKVEIIVPTPSSSSQYHALVVSGATFKLPIYPGMHLAPNGKIYFTGTNWGQEINNPKTRALTVDLDTHTGVWEDFSNNVEPNQPRREEGMSLLLHQKLPPAAPGKILLFGGTHALDSSNRIIMQNGGPSNFDKINNVTDTKSAEILDTNQNPPTWTATNNNLSFGRVNGHGVLLPDETVLIVGGHNFYKWNTTANGTRPSLECEIFDGTNFRTVASLSFPRMYHSTALLLPDGQVMVTGGAHPDELEPALFQNPDGSPKRFVPPLNHPTAGFERPYPDTWVGPVYGAIRSANGAYFSIALNRKDYEIYKPPYFFKGPRPTIADVKRNGVSNASQLYYEESFVIETPEAADITIVALMRPGCPTHHTDSEQRYVELEFTTNGNELTVTIGDNRSLSPPGYYMLWIIREAVAPLTGLVPCERAKFIHLVDPVMYMDPVTVTGNKGPCIIATTTMGSANHEMVLYLQNLRTSIQTSSDYGARFIHTINAIYYSFSPQIATILSKDDAAKKLVRTLVVRPTVRIIRSTEQWVNGFKKSRNKKRNLVHLLLAESLLSLVFMPILGLITLKSSIQQKFKRNGRK